MYKIAFGLVTFVELINYFFMNYFTTGFINNHIIISFILPFTIQ